jgi:type II secretory pathway pseudopilin PulG
MKSERCMTYGRQDRGSAGFTLVEVMIAVGVLVVMALGAGVFFGDLGTRIHDLEVKSKCRNVAQLFLKQFTDNQNSLNISNYLPKGIQNDFTTPVDHPVNGGLYDRNILTRVNGQVVYMNHQLIENRIHQTVNEIRQRNLCVIPDAQGNVNYRALQMYANPPGAPPNTMTWAGFAVYQSKADSRISALPNTYWCPTTASPDDVYPNSGSQLRIFTRIDIMKQDNSGVEATCDASAAVEYTTDSRPPQLTVTATNADLMEVNRDMISCGKDPASTQDTMNSRTVSRDNARTITYTLKADEPGVIFECFIAPDNSAPTKLSTWKPCCDPTWPAQTAFGAGALVDSLTNAENPASPDYIRGCKRGADYGDPTKGTTTLEVTVQWPTEGRYQVYFDALDSSADPLNWNSNKKHPTLPITPTGLETPIDLVRPRVVLTGTGGSIKPPSALLPPDVQAAFTGRNFVCGPVTQDATVQYTIADGQDIASKNCRCLLQRGGDTGSFFALWDSGITDAASCGCVSGANTMTLKKELLTRIGEETTPAKLGSTGVTSSIAVRDACNDNHCGGVFGGFGPNSPFWSLCDTSKQYAYNAITPVNIEVNLRNNLSSMFGTNDSNRNQSPYSAPLQSPADVSYQVDNNQQVSRLNPGTAGFFAAFKNDFGPEVVIESRNSVGTLKYTNWKQGFGTPNFRSWYLPMGAVTDRGCEGKVSFNAYDPCNNRKHIVTNPAKGNETYAIATPTGATCTKVDCEGFSFCDNSKVCMVPDASYTINSTCTETPAASGNFSCPCAPSVTYQNFNWNLWYTDPVCYDAVSACTCNYLNSNPKFDPGGALNFCPDLSVPPVVDSPVSAPITNSNPFPAPVDAGCTAIGTQHDGHQNLTNTDSFCACAAVCTVDNRTIPQECLFQGMPGSTAANPNARMNFSSAGMVFDPVTGLTVSFAAHCGRYYTQNLIGFSGAAGTTQAVDTCAATNICPPGSTPLPPQTMCNLSNSMLELYAQISANACFPSANQVFDPSCALASRGAQGVCAP